MLTRQQLNVLYIVYAARREGFYTNRATRAGGRDNPAYQWRVAWWYELDRWSKAVQDYEGAQRCEGGTANNQERT